MKRQASGRPNYVTAAGLAALRRRLEELAALRAALQARQKPEEARSLELRQAEADIAYYEERVKTARLVDNRGLAAGEVRFGARVTVRGADGAEKTYSIVGEDEADAASGKLNWASPLAAALMGKRTGDRAVLVLGRTEQVLEVAAVEYPAG